jgi:LytS/YehU family sensor histidine kinase
MLERLGELLRDLLAYSEAQEVPLAQELNFLQHYLAMQNGNVEDGIDMTVEIDPQVGRALVPTFILQTLVEAVIVRETSCALDRQCLVVRASENNGFLKVSVQSSGDGWVPKAEVGEDLEFGFSKIRERLRWLYGEHDHAFTISGRPGTGLQVDLSVPFHEDEAGYC